MRTLIAVSVACLTIGMMDGCKNPPKKPDADTTKSGAKNPVPENIESVKTNAAAAIAAAEKITAANERVAANAAASVDAAKRVNTNQPASKLTTFVDLELGEALKRLPPPDATTALEVEKRRSAVLEGRVDEANRLYAKASTEADEAKVEAARLRTDADAANSKHEAAVAALVAADKRWEAQLVANEKSNQAKIDAAEARAKKAQDDLLAAERRKDVLWLRIAAIAFLAAGIGIGVLTNGLQLGKSIGFGIGSVLCFGLAQIVASPYFMPVCIGCLVVSVLGVGWWAWRERQDALAKEAYQRTVQVLEENHVAVGQDGKRTALGQELEAVLDTSHKNLVTGLRKGIKIKLAKDAVEDAKAA